MSFTKLSSLDIEKKIVAEYYTTGPQAFRDAPIHDSVATLTICVLVLENGFVVTGDSNVIDPNNFDAETGRQVARSRAFSKIWELEGYLVKEGRHQAQADDGC